MTGYAGILNEQLQLLDSGQNSILTMRQSPKMPHNTAEIKIYAKYFMEIIIHNV